MNITFLDSRAIGSDISLDALREVGNLTVEERTEQDEVAEKLSDTEVLIVNKLKLDHESLKNAKKLKLICVTATGYDNIDVDYCKEHGIGVCNVVGYSSHSVAQVTAAMVLYLSTHLFEYTSYVRSGEYTKVGSPNKLSPVFNELYKKTWGIIGYGNIGKEVGAVASALGCDILKYRKTKAPDCVDLEYLLENSDIISIHTPLTDETRGLIGEKELDMMKKSAILVNTSRGAVTDEAAVAKAVKEGKIAAFGTDVYSHEPFGEDEPLYEIKSLPNVCLTPHMAWGAFEARTRCIDEIAENIRDFYAGGTRNRVDLY